MVLNHVNILRKNSKKIFYANTTTHLMEVPILIDAY